MQLDTYIEQRVRQKFHALPTQFPKTEVLSGIARRLLKVLEVRSYKNNGDTKIYNIRLAALLRCSVRTIDRALNELESHKFIYRNTTRGFDSTRRRYGVSPFYAIRTFRCNRVALASNYRFLTRQVLKWKTDNRPVFNPAHSNLPTSWFIPNAITVIDGFDCYEIKPAWNNYVQLAARDQFDPRILGLHARLSTWAQFGKREAIDWIGYVDI